HTPRTIESGTVGDRAAGESLPLLRRKRRPALPAGPVLHDPLQLSVARVGVLEGRPVDLATGLLVFVCGPRDAVHHVIARHVDEEVVGVAEDVLRLRHRRQLRHARIGAATVADESLLCEDTLADTASRL